MKRKRMILGLCCCALGSVAAQAQNPEQHSDTAFQVKGVLVDSLLQEKEPYATIRVVRPDAPEKVVRMAVTGLDGVFQLSLRKGPTVFPSLRWESARLSVSLPAPPRRK